LPALRAGRVLSLAHFACRQAVVNLAARSRGADATVLATPARVAAEPALRFLCPRATPDMLRPPRGSHGSAAPRAAAQVTRLTGPGAGSGLSLAQAGPADAE
jgi:hypothetical protein